MNPSSKKSSCLFIYDGSCPFCSYFAEFAELRSGIPDLLIKDGRSDLDLLRELSQNGYNLKNGAILKVEDQILYGSEAVQWVCSRMKPSNNLLSYLVPLMSKPSRSRTLYPLLLLARKMILKLKSIPEDPLATTSYHD